MSDLTYDVPVPKDRLGFRAMQKSKRARLEAAGWKVGTAQELLGLTDEDTAYVEIKLALARALRQRRTRKGLTQTQVAKRVRSSQSRLAKMEACDETVYCTPI